MGLSDPTTGYFGLANQYANQFISSGFPINMLSYIAQNSSAQALQTVGGDIGTGLSEGLQSVGGSVSSGLGNLGAFGAAGLSAETSAVTGRTTGSLKVNLHRALKRLRTRLDQAR